MQVTSFFHIDTKEKSREAFLEALVADVSDSPVGFAGLAKKEDLRETLEWQVFDDRGDSFGDGGMVAADAGDIHDTITQALATCEEVLPPVTETHVFVFPTFSDFVAKEMNGSGGFAPRGGVVLVFLSAQHFTWEALRQTVVHEYNHAVFFAEHPALDPLNDENTVRIRDVLISEGLAENFVADVLGEQSPISQRISEEEAQEQLTRMREQVETVITEEDETYERIFFGRDGIYPQWTGYAVGYHIVRAYRDAHPEKTWQELVAMDPKELFSQSPFGDK